MRALEESYRRALRWYPAGWRAANGDALVGTLLDTAEAEGRAEPTRAELRDLRWRGLDQRGLDALPEPVRERAGALALGAGATIAAIDLVFREWDPWDPAILRAPVSFGQFESPAVVLDLLWLVALLSAVAGSRAVMRTALAVDVVGTIALISLPFAPWNAGRPATTVLLASAALAAAALLAPRPTARSRAWIGLAALAAVIAMGVGSLNLYGATRYSTGFWDLRAWSNFFVFGALDPVWYGFALLVLAAALYLARRRWWAGAIVTAFGPWWIGMDAAHLARSGPGETVWAGFFALLFVGALIARAAGYRWRRGNGIQIRP